MQSPSPAQEVLQAVAPQTYALHDWVWTAGHEPPLHEAESVSTPDEQDAPRHCAVGYEQAETLTPSQLPPQADPSLAHAAREPCGEPVTALQTPTLPGTSQAWHWPLQALLQQIPSTQLPFEHWFAAEHEPPSAIFGTQAPALQ